jgi:hypothetical protein
MPSEYRTHDGQGERYEQPDAEHLEEHRERYGTDRVIRDSDRVQNRGDSYDTSWKEKDAAQHRALPLRVAL